MRPDIAKALELYDEASNLAIDWLIKSWSLKEEDKTIALAYYRKACKERVELAKRLNELVKEGGGKNEKRGKRNQSVTETIDK